MRAKWLLVIAGPSVALLAASMLALTFLPHPVPRTATGARRDYLVHCASCHGADGRGSWRATLFLMRPGDLADTSTLDPLTDEYLFDLIKHGGAPMGKPGMPSFGFHLTDEQIRELVASLRRFPDQQRSGNRPRHITGASAPR